MKTILLVDDDAHLRELVAVTLGSGDLRVLTATNGLEAVELATREKPDLIVLDWMMPKLSGVQVVARLRQQGVLPPVIMLTAKSQKKDLDSARAAGVCHYLVKPFSPLELLGKVHEILSASDPA